MNFTTGIGFDAHKFSTTKPMHLAGLTWDDEIGIEGHSDGDVAAHAICDALLSAAHLGDLGSVFGTSDPQWAGADRKSTRLNSSHVSESRMPSSA